MNARIFALLLALLVAAPLFARDKSDVIIMNNGDRVTFEIKGLDADTLFISVDYILNTLSVDWSKVDHVESKQMFIVKTQDGLVYSGALSTPTTPGGRAVKLQILEVSDTKVDLDKTRSSKWTKRPAISGSASMGTSVWGLPTTKATSPPNTI